MSLARLSVSGLRSINRAALLDFVKSKSTCAENKIDTVCLARYNAANLAVHKTQIRYYWIDTRVGKYVIFDEFKKFVDDDKTLVIDVRNKEEVENGRINVSQYTNIPLREFGEALNLSNEDFEDAYKVKKPSKDQQFVIHCLGGVRSSIALRLAEQAGYDKYVHENRN